MLFVSIPITPVACFLSSFRACLSLVGLVVALIAGLTAPVVATSPGTGPQPVSSPTATTVRGRVLNEEGKPLVGATVLWKGSPFGVTTDSNGNYQLPLAAGRTVVLFSYAGYTDDEISVRGPGVQNITLIPKEASVATPDRRVRRVLR